VLELAPTEATVLTCLGSRDAVDAAVALGGVEAGRVAPDEAMLIVPAGRDDERSEAVSAAVLSIDADALVIDTTDGWSIWTMSGAERELDRAMARLTALRLTDSGFAQGDLARVPVKLFVARGSVRILVPSMWGAYLRARILERCATLQIGDRRAPRAWEVPA
jgi:hypothetical protein